MSALLDLLGTLHALGINLWREGERLRYDAPQGVLTPALLARLREHKAELLQVLGERQADGTIAQTPPHIPPAPRGRPLPLSSAQQRVWLHERLYALGATYNLPAAWRISGPLEHRVLERSLTEVVRRHESLRTTFAESEGQPVQIISAPQPVAVPLHDLRLLKTQDRQAAAEHLIAQEAQRPFDLVRGPVLRSLVVRLGDEDHILALTFHHIVADGWAIRVFFDEFMALYAAYREGRPSPLPELKIQYADFSVWQWQQLDSPDAQRHLEYFRTQLAGAPSLLELPSLHPAPASPSFAGAVATVQIDPGCTSQLQALARQSDATLYMVLLAAFNVLLHRYTGQADLLVGSPIAGRDLQEIEPLIGFFANTIVVRTRLAGEQSFRVLLRQVRETALAAFAHQALPFERLIQELSFERHPGHPPLVQVNFALAAEATPPLHLADLHARQIDVPLTSVKWNLGLHIEPTADGLLGFCEYRTDLFDTAMIEQLLGHYQQLLAGIVANPEQPIAAVPLLTERERRQLLVTWNHRRDEAQTLPCVHVAFAQQAERTPDAVAVVFESQSLTYRDLDRRSNQLARYLQAQGVGPGSLVGLCIERSLDMVIALLGILKAGGAYVPLDPALPEQRLAYMIGDAQLAWVVTQQDCVAPLPASVQRICIDDESAALCHVGEGAVTSSSGPADLAYVIYTSGSTGRPKGVAVEHRQISAYVQRIDGELGLGFGARYANVSTLAADLGNTPLFVALCRGGTLVVLSYEQCMNPERLARDLRHAPIDCLKITPSHLAALLTAAESEHVLPRRALVLGGEALRWELLEKVERLAPSCRSYNEYGPTETTVGVTIAGPLRSQGSAAPAVYAPIGIPFADTQIYILDSLRQPVPPGVVGEIYIGGCQVARGYLNRPDLTAERFVDLSFPEFGIFEQRVYRTGDLGRYLPDGSIDFLGRADHQVKVRGFRVELGEIEAALRRQAGVREAVVVLSHDQGPPQLVAYVTVDGPGVDPNALHRGLAEELPGYMVPGTVMALASMPLNANGKLDISALPKPKRSTDRDKDTQVEEPSANDKTANVLLGIWRDLLGNQNIGIHDNFFALGGDSIIGIQVVARAHRAGVHIPAGLIFQYPTIAGLARVATWQDSPAAEQGPVTGPLPLTPIQEAFFADDPREPHHFNMSALHVVPSDLDTNHLRAALRHLLVHHDALRLRFRKQATAWSQENAPPAEEGDEEALSFAVVDLGHLPAAEQSEALTKQASALQASLDLASGPLVRWIYFRLGASARLLTVVHHLVIDGVSWRILLEDLETAYRLLSLGSTIVLPAKTTSFRTWAQWLQREGAAAMGEDLPYWQAIARTPGMELPRDQVDSQRSLRARVSATLPMAQTEALLQIAPAAYGTQINDLLLTALAETLSPWLGRSELLIELEGHGREGLSGELDLSRTVGWFTSVFPVRLLLTSGDRGARIKSIKEQLRQIPQRGVSYGVLRYLARDPDLVHMPRVRIGFNYLGQIAPTGLAEPESGGQLVRAAATEDIGPLHSPLGPVPYFIHVNGIVQQRCLHLDWIYDASRFKQATIERLSREFLANLDTLISHCASQGVRGYTPSDFPKAALSQDELDALITELG